MIDSRRGKDIHTSIGREDYGQAGETALVHVQQ